jgi:hypothetical protein
MVKGEEMKLSDLFRKFQIWLDGDDLAAEPSVAEVPLNEWDEFFLRLAREVEAVMKREMFTPPGGLTYLPVEYIIYLSRDDNEEWHGRKREGLLEGLRHALAQRARELVGDKVLKSDRISLTLGVDGALDKGQIRVQPVWDDDSPRTEVSVRKRKDDPAAQKMVEEPDLTVVRPPSPLFGLRWQRGGGEPSLFVAHKARIGIGRGSRDFAIDLQLSGDQEISRHHAQLERLGAGEYRLECVGRNSIEVSGRELAPGERIDLRPGASFSLS